MTVENLTKLQESALKIKQELEIEAANLKERVGKMKLEDGDDEEDEEEDGSEGSCVIVGEESEQIDLEKESLLANQVVEKSDQPGTLLEQERRHGSDPKFNP